MVRTDTSTSFTKDFPDCEAVHRTTCADEFTLQRGKGLTKSQALADCLLIKA